MQGGRSAGGTNTPISFDGIHHLAQCMRRPNTKHRKRSNHSVWLTVKAQARAPVP